MRDACSLFLMFYINTFIKRYSIFSYIGNAFHKWKESTSYSYFRLE